LEIVGQKTLTTIFQKTLVGKDFRFFPLLKGQLFESLKDKDKDKYPRYTFFCTCRASRRTFGKLLPNHQLHTVTAHCGYDLKKHHHALSDAEACAKIAKQTI
jgi:DNA polymerase III epsilon subunit-like protein